MTIGVGEIVGGRRQARDRRPGSREVRRPRQHVAVRSTTRSRRGSTSRPAARCGSRSTSTRPTARPTSSTRSPISRARAATSVPVDVPRSTTATPTPEPQKVSLPEVWDYNAFLSRCALGGRARHERSASRCSAAATCGTSTIKIGGKEKLADRARRAAGAALRRPHVQARRATAREYTNADERDFSIWISDDDGRVPLQIDRTHRLRRRQDGDRRLPARHRHAPAPVRRSEREPRRRLASVQLGFAVRPSSGTASRPCR